MAAKEVLKVSIKNALTKGTPANTVAAQQLEAMANEIALAVDVYTRAKLLEMIQILVTPGLYISTAPGAPVTVGPAGPTLSNIVR